MVIQMLKIKKLVILLDLFNKKDNDFYSNPNNAHQLKNIKTLRKTQSMTDSLYFHPELKNRTKKHFWIHPILSFFKKKKNKVNFICFTTLMMNLFIIMEFTVKIESLWGLASVGKFYILIYIADVIGAILSFCFVNKFSRSVLNRIHSLSLIHI